MVEDVESLCTELKCQPLVDWEVFDIVKFNQLLPGTFLIVAMQVAVGVICWC